MLKRRARASDDTLAITLRLKRIDDLFEAPAITPFDPHFGPSSFTAGIDYVAAEMQRHGGAKHTDLTLLLPPEQIAAAPDLEPRAREALRRYAEARTSAANQTHGIERRQVRTVGVIAILFFALSNLLSVLYARTGSLFGASGIVLDVVLEGLVVGGWVALWWPFDLVFQVWEHRLEERTYRALPDITLRILPDPDPPSPRVP